MLQHLSCLVVAVFRVYIAGDAYTVRKGYVIEEIKPIGWVPLYVIGTTMYICMSALPFG